MNAEKAEQLKDAHCTIAYAHVIPTIRDIARRYGYAATIHGSMQRDLDILLCPWTRKAQDPHKLVAAIVRKLKLYKSKVKPNPEQKPHGRIAWSFYFDRLSAMRRVGPYLDISVMPLKPIDLADNK